MEQFTTSENFCVETWTKNLNPAILQISKFRKHQELQYHLGLLALPQCGGHSKNAAADKFSKRFLYFSSETTRIKKKVILESEENSNFYFDFITVFVKFQHFSVFYF